MIKAAAAWILVVIGGFLSGTSLTMTVVYFYREAKMHSASRRLISALLSPPPAVPDVVGVEIPCFRFKILTSPWVLLIGLLGVGLLVVAVGLHLHYFHRLDVGRQRLEMEGALSQGRHTP